MLIRKRGFTLLELMIVIALIGVLTVVAIPCYRNYMTKAKVTEFFSLAQLYKLQATEDLVSGVGLSKRIAQPTALVDLVDIHTQMQERGQGHKYQIDIIANNQHLGLALIEGLPLRIRFQGQEEKDFVVWHCYVQMGYKSYVPGHCKETSI